VERGAAVAPRETPCGEPAEDAGQDHVLGGEHTRSQILLGFAGSHIEPRLQNDRAAIEFRRREMDACAVLGVAGLEAAAMGVESAIFRQQRGMNVDEPAGKALGELRGQNAHEPCEHDDLRTMRFEHARQRALEGGTICERFPRHDFGGETQFPRDVDAASAVTICHNDADFGVNQP
jgi:hypothetical protein